MTEGVIKPGSGALFLSRADLARYMGVAENGNETLNELWMLLIKGGITDSGIIAVVKALAK